MRKLLILFSVSMSVLLYACDGASGDNTSSGNADNSSAAANNSAASYDPERGEGKFSNVELSDKLNTTIADAGEKVYGVKCAACHKLTDEKLVGPGWKGVTTRHKPEWIMNFVTNPDAMLDKDPKAQAMLEICMVRMPNQNLSDDDARSVLEFMRKNDGVQ
ncbi:cytochrome c [Ilyomonas limi]|uniref:Cytochrome c n=1 Tax=Ilyomonas limi TaxID=2575867 RepID=A0A4U3L2W2_9BACT|nr:cytochrome c [Ilyomonas limi]TKK68584.1 cytochrome c [Ilyomonas limi]